MSDTDETDAQKPPPLFTPSGKKWSVKTEAMYSDPSRGYRYMKASVQYMLDWVATLCEEQGYPLPVVTELGRTKDDQEEAYFQFYKQHLSDLAKWPQLEQVAREMARTRWSNHCIAVPNGEFAAFDLRSWIYTPKQREVIVAKSKDRFPKAEILYHRVAGDGFHFHFGEHWPVKPREWV